MRPRVLVEHADPHVGRAIARRLHDRGFAVATCPGPTGRRACPPLHGRKCSLAGRADVIVSDLRDHPAGSSVAVWLGVEHPRIPLLRNLAPDAVVPAVRAALAR